MAAKDTRSNIISNVSGKDVDINQEGNSLEQHCQGSHLDYDGVLSFENDIGDTANPQEISKSTSHSLPDADSSNVCSVFE